MTKFLILLLAFFSFSKASLASVHFKDASTDSKAQALFDKGMLNYYGYLYVQAEYDFRQALMYDPKCALCYWGLAVAKKQEAVELGKPFATVGYDYIVKARRLVVPQNNFQYALINATSQLFSLSPVSSKRLQRAYVDELKGLYSHYKNDPQWQLESLALLVDAMFYSGVLGDEGLGMPGHCSPHAANQYKKESLELMTPILNNSAYPDHPGLLHTYIHMAQEQTTNPLGLTVAKKLAPFAEAGVSHYAHMPTHIYSFRGMYPEAIQANLDAITIDKEYFKNNGVGLNSYYYEMHYLHSHHYLVVLGILTNNYSMALHYAQQIKDLMDVSRIAVLPAYRDTLLTLEHLVQARFSHWDEVLKLKTPIEAQEQARLLIDFTHALAHLNLNQQQAFDGLYKSLQNQKYNNPMLKDLQTLTVTYLTAAAMEKKQASFQQLEQLFLNKGIDTIEEKFFLNSNPTFWLFPYALFLSDTAKSRSDAVNQKKYHEMFEKRYPKATK